jgi:hypothetical protein
MHLGGNERRAYWIGPIGTHNQRRPPGGQYAVADGHPAPSGDSPVPEGRWVHDEQVVTMIDMNRRREWDEGAHERAQMMAEMGRVIEVVRTFIPAEWPEVQAALRGETLVAQQTPQAVEGVRMVPIDDTSDEDGT